MNAMIEIFTNPGNVFEAQKEDSSWLMPALVILGVTILSSIAVYMNMDLGGAMQAQIENTVKMLETSGAPQETIDQTRMQMEQATAVQANPLMAIGGQVLGVLIMFFVVVLLHAVYYLIVGKILKADFDFSDWLAFSVWGRMPWVVGGILILIAAFVMDPQSAPEKYNWLAFSNYVDLPNQGVMVLGEFVKTVDLIVLWTIAVMTIGFNNWTEKGIATSLAVVAAPYVVIYGLLMLI